jgi:DNA-binding MarR family transcriptional regulator
MNARNTLPLPLEPPPAVLEALRERLSGPELQALVTLFAVRTTGQHVANVVTEWMADSAGSTARFQILVRLWACRGVGVAHKELVAALGVTRATISGLMAGLERDGLVTSATAVDDRRSMLASLTPKGVIVVEKAVEANKLRLRATFGGLSVDELTALTSLLQRVRDQFQKDPKRVAAPVKWVAP